MKTKEVIRRTDLAKPNAFEEELKFLWLTALEGCLLYTSPSPRD